MWIVDHLDDVESDMSVFHRVDDVYTLPGARFFKLATRLPAYQGVLRARLEAEVAQEQQRHTPAASRPSAAVPAPVQDVPAAAARAHAGFAGDGHKFPPVFGPRKGNR